jgi:hypothetical protein
MLAIPKTASLRRMTQSATRVAVVNIETHVRPASATMTGLGQDNLLDRSEHRGAT